MKKNSQDNKSTNYLMLMFLHHIFWDCFRLSIIFDLFFFSAIAYVL